jgi:hypothetical protein
VGDEHTPETFLDLGGQSHRGDRESGPNYAWSRGGVQLKRKLPTEKTERLGHADRGHFDRLCRMLARFALDNGAAIQAARPDLPETLNDRVQDNWEPLLVAAVLDRATAKHDKPYTVRSGAQSSAAARSMTWAYQRGALLEFIRPGKPAQNSFIASFNGKLHDEISERESGSGPWDREPTKPSN